MIRSFTLLAEHLHFGKTADLLNLTQPALTKQIRRLEAKLGSSLFERGNSKTRLTSVGELFLPEARLLVQNFDSLLEKGRQFSTGERGRLRIGFGFTTIDLLPHLVVELRKRFPHVEISLKDMSSVEQMNGLRSGQLDIGFVRLPVKAEFNQRPVSKDRLIIIASDSLSLPQKATLADCKLESFIMIAKEPSPTFNAHALALCAQAGFHPKIIQESTEVATIMALVRAGLGVSLIPESYFQRPYPGVQRFEIKAKEAAWSIGAVWRKEDNNPVLLAFLELLKAVPSSQQSDKKR